MGNFFIFILVLFALAALLRIDFFFTILYLFAGVYIISRFWSRRVLRSLKVSRTMERRAFLGERLTVTLTLDSTSTVNVRVVEVSYDLSELPGMSPRPPHLMTETNATLGGRRFLRSGHLFVTKTFQIPAAEQ